jgi:predicted O-methyltransferase YrrM
LAWLDDSRFSLESQVFRIASGDEPRTISVAGDDLPVVKTRALIDRYVELAAAVEPAPRVVELGIYEGGSTAFLTQLLQPSSLLAIDIASERAPALDRFIAERDLGESVHLLYGIDQGDADELVRVIGDHIGDQPLDLVIDDASHQYVPTRTSFSLLFPRLRAGGYFVIEDWDWAHRPEELWQADGGYFRRFPALTNLIVEILMLAGSDTDVVRKVVVQPEMVVVERGSAPLEPAMDLDRIVYNRGLRFRPLL